MTIVASGVSTEGGAGSPIKRGGVVGAGEDETVSTTIGAIGPRVFIAIGEVGNRGGVGGFESKVLAAVSELSGILAGDGGNADSVTKFKGCLIRDDDETGTRS
ncbi:hypothetical protein V2O64_25290 (plasmid) [Verrucomicrobiaceae bacterium 227]